MSTIKNHEDLFGQIVEDLDIPVSYYEKAKRRAASLEEWLLRENSTVKELRPEVYPQGSFRYGTVVRPITEDGYYDLDLVVTFQASLADVTQKHVKSLLGNEIQSYSIARNFNEEPSEKPRCWRLDYADEINFHMDVLPGLPALEQVVQERLSLSVPRDFAKHEIAITDNRHPFYDRICFDWYSSNPRGFAKWFESNAKKYAQHRMSLLLESRAYASIEEIPPYELKTVLQRVIQILKRHRDVHFQENSKYAPISMIITTLATHAYQGEDSLVDAMLNVVKMMPNFIKSTRPRIANPVNSKEDFADKWSDDPRYELNFRAWHTQLTSDLSTLIESSNLVLVKESVSRSLSVSITKDIEPLRRPAMQSSAVHSSSAPIVLRQGSQPWSD